ncbi:unnamed protein product, partial [Aphanomyces euteiches]
MLRYFEKTQTAFRELVVHRASDGATYYYECHVTPIRDEKTTTFIGHLIAFGNRTETVQKANNDELTGLPNRRYIGEWLERRVSLQEAGEDPYAVLFLDLDGFKQVNDTLGHEIGDKLLQEVSAVLKRSIDEQCIAARWAGDEFVILVEQVVHPVELDQLANRVISAIQHIEKIEGHPVAISGSMGIALGNEAGVDAKTILHQADQAIQMPRSLGGLDVAGEWNAFRARLPEVRDEKVLDLGRGFGWHCRYVREQQTEIFMRSMWGEMYPEYYKGLKGI